MFDSEQPWRLCWFSGCTHRTEINAVPADPPLGPVAFQPFRPRDTCWHTSASRSDRFECQLVTEDELLTGSGQLTPRQPCQCLVADVGRHRCCPENGL